MVPFIAFTIPLQFIDFGLGQLLQNRRELFNSFLLPQNGCELWQETAPQVLVVDRATVVTVSNEVETLCVNLNLFSNRMCNCRPIYSQ